MRYTLFFPSSLFPLPSSLFPLHSSLLRSPCSEVPKNQRFVPHGYKTCYSKLGYYDYSRSAINWLVTSMTAGGKVNPPSDFSTRDRCLREA
ncbi:hypothetical protein, partial [Moorena sp. SIO4A5]|uniref:hypothetical protein n=1 Tax=Moorena sp. SIO4A5 TaxID=2607838 RepID=UPI0013C65836